MMKASLYNPQHFMFSLKISLLLALVTITWHISVTECADLNLSGEVGGNVTIRCPFDKDRKISFFYFQKGHMFVNGYYGERKMDQKQVPKWNNTRLDRDNNTVYMYNLTVAHSGDYQCHIKYSESDLINETKIHLSVTANYSKPEVKQYCSSKNQVFGCLVTCASHGGYPDQEIVWNVDGAQMWNVVNISKTKDPHTRMFSVYSSAYYNCSNGPLEALSCSVGAITSEMFSICKPKDPSEGGWPYITEVAAILAVVFLMVMLLVWWKCRKRQRGAAAAAPGDVRERVALNATQGEEGASC
ncbi:CD276 antigen [Morone saxatilis]|uniref:CD276 antigen n=1 Tax=Morone saxatilis TaxID=34816 RepID=UPI0015E255CD|nr:CD276 antigen [Morone saxatilis]